MLVSYMPLARFSGRRGRPAAVHLLQFSNGAFRPRHPALRQDSRRRHDDRRGAHERRGPQQLVHAVRHGREARDRKRPLRAWVDTRGGSRSFHLFRVFRAILNSVTGEQYPAFERTRREMTALSRSIYYIEWHLSPRVDTLQTRERSRSLKRKVRTKESPVCDPVASRRTTSTTTGPTCPRPSP